MNNYDREMKHCISLAKKAFGKTSPNPLVGCVVINSDGEVISTGYHKKYGEFHAERDALNKSDNAKGCTLVVNLEPCCHHGKTPPCTDIILEKGIKKVVYGMKDPNPLVSGKGLKILKDAGVEVVGPVLEDECKNLNEIFIKNKIKGETFVAIKTATTADGKIATSTGDSKWITSDKARKTAHKLRTYYDAILTSSSTVIADNPKMRHKKKIIIDRNLKTDINSNIYQQGEIIVFHSDKIKAPQNTKNITYISAPETNNCLDIKYILNKIFELGIMSVFIEAGGRLCGSFIPYADKIYHFIAPKILNDNSGKSCFDGANADKISQCAEFEICEIKKIGKDVLITYKK